MFHLEQTSMFHDANSFIYLPPLAFTRHGSLQLKFDGTRCRTGQERKGKLANGVGSQYSSHYLIT